MVPSETGDTFDTHQTADALERRIALERAVARVARMSATGQLDEKAVAEEAVKYLSELLDAHIAVVARAGEEAREQLRDIAQRDRMVMSVAGDGVSDVDVPTGNVWWSDRLLTGLGYNADTFGGTLDWVLEHVVHPADQRAIAGLLVRGEPLRNTVVRMRHADGSFRVMSVRSALAFDENGNPIRRVSLYQDVTERERAESQRLALARELHDSVIENLAAARAHAQTAQMTTDADSAAASALRALSRHVEAAEDSLRLVVRALRADTTLLDARGPLSAVVETLASELQRRDPRMHVVVADQLPDDTTVTADAVAVCTQVLRESLLNVLQHACADRVTVSLTPDPNAVRLEISDDGDGFDVSSEAGRALLARWRAKAATVGADVALRSIIGGGTVVKLTVPVHARQPAADARG